MTKIEKQGPPLAEEEVADLERMVDARLPESYRRFLLAYNGGRPALDMIDVPLLPGGGETDVQVFFGLGVETETSDIRWNVKTLSNRIPRGLLPVATDSAGSLFCLALKGPDAGKIFFWDSGNSFYTTAEDIGQIYPVAQSIDEFLEKLRLLK